VDGRRPELTPNRTTSDRILDVITGLDLVYVVVLLACAIGWGVYTVAGWMLEAWRAEAWWRLALLAGTSLFLLAGTVRELARRRVGAFSLVTGSISLMLGASQALLR
jgi:hypothetical protein